MLPKHPFGTDAVIQVFHENHITNITKGMGLLEVEVFPRVVNLMVKSGNFKALFFFVFRPLTFSLQSALQDFGPTLQTFKELWRFYKNTVTCCQEFLQPNINSNGMTVGCWVGNVDITLQRNRCVPFNRPIPDGFVAKQVQALSKVRGTQWYVVVTIESSVSVPDAL